MDKNIEHIFYPGSICIAGASSKKGSIGFELTSTILSYGYTGKLLLINPKSDEILGIKCLSSVTDIQEQIDLAIILVPKNFVEQTITDLIGKGVKSFILITAGFRETGKEGEAAENRILRMIKESGSRMTGPNCMGVINTLEHIKLNATFVAEKPETGSTAFLSQSGALGAAVLNSLRETDIKFAHFISVGNKADLNENDLIAYWEKDNNIKVITLYLESFSNGENLLSQFVNESISKPVIILKAGRTKSGIKAASSHTGALGSSDKVVDSIINQFGMIRADNLNELFITAKGFENYPMPRGGRVAVLTNAGGPAILAVDMLERRGLKLAELSESTRSKLREIVHPEGSVNNPVDLLPGGSADVYKKASELLLKDENTDAVVSIFVEPVMVKPLELIEGINSIDSSKPLMQVVMPLPEFWSEYRSKTKHNKPLFRNPEDPAVVLSNMLKYNKFDFKKERLKKRETLKAEKFSRGILSVEEVEVIGKAYHLPLVNGSVVNTAALESNEFDYPLVLKANSKEVSHKSELSGVALNIRNKEELLKAANEMKKNFKTSGIDLDNFLIQPFIETRFELLVGGFRDPDFGPMVMFGTGGKYVEYYEDTHMCSAFVSDTDIEKIVNETKISKLLKGVRGEKPADAEQLKVIIKSVAQMMIDSDFIMECDLNPLILTPSNKYFAVDIRIKTA